MEISAIRLYLLKAAFLVHKLVWEILEAAGSVEYPEYERHAEDPPALAGEGCHPGRDHGPDADPGVSSAYGG